MRWIALAIALFLPPVLADQQHVNRGQAPFDGGGDPPWTYLGKIESNFNELYAANHRNTNSLPVNATAFGAVGDGETDNYAALTSGIAYAKLTQRALWIPAGTYNISQTVTIPSNVAIYGEPADSGYKGNTPKRTVIQATGAFTALQTPRLTYPNDNLPFWSTYIDMRDLYIEGPYLQANAVAGIAGLDMTGSRVINVENLHAEGFGSGFVFRNCSEIAARNLIAENCFYGAEVGRKTDQVGSVVYDCMVLLANPYLLANQIDLLADNPRSLWVEGGELINNVNTNNVSIVNCNSDTHITFHAATLENHAPALGNLTTDTNGVGKLELVACNLETDQNAPVIVANGFFDFIGIRGCSMERYVTNSHAPLVWAKYVAGNNGFLRANQIQVEANTPSWFDAFVRNDQQGARPENDYVPSSYEQINPNPNCDHALDGTISVAGDYSYSTNSLCGLARTWWNSTTTNNVFSFLCPTNRTKGIDQIYVTAVVYDNAGAAIPVLNVQGWGQQGDWNSISQAKIGAYTNSVSGAVFSKWAWTVTLFNQDQAATNGLWEVQLFNVYGTASGTNYGLERFSVYAPRQKNPDPLIPIWETHSSIPITGLEGWHPASHVYRNDFTQDQTAYGWINTSKGNPGVYRKVSVGGELEVKTGAFLAVANKLYSNEGAGSQVAATLPQAFPGAQISFLTRNAVGWIVNAAGVNTIRLGGQLSSAGGNVTDTVLGDTLTLIGINTNEWLQLSATGTNWTAH